MRERFKLSWGKARAFIESGKVKVDGEVVLDPGAEITDEALSLEMNAPRAGSARERPDVNVVFKDAHVVVVEKPAGVSTVPYEEGERGTLVDLVTTIVSTRGRASLGVVHRLDKETSGLVVFTRTWLAKKSLASQFRAHSVHRLYLAIVHGAMTSRTIRSMLVENRGDGLRGSAKGAAPPNAQRAVTHVDALESLRGATLVACRLETGRTHQIRIHLSEAGHPLVGERVYVRRFEGPTIAAPRLMLHAAELGFVHPATERPMKWTSEMPRDMRGVLARL